MKDFRLLGSSEGVYFGDSNDIVLDPNTSDIKTLEGIGRIRQAVSKILLTPTGMNYLDVNYGSDLPKMKFSPVIYTEIQSSLRESIIRSLDYLTTIETSELASEKISSLESIEVYPQEKSGYIIKLILKLEDGSFLIIILGE